MRGVLHERKQAEEHCNPAHDEDSHDHRVSPPLRHVRHGRDASGSPAIEVKAGRGGAMHDSRCTRTRPAGQASLAGENSETRGMIERAWSDYKATGSLAARDLLVIHYMAGHVRRIANRLCARLPRQIDPDDLVQHAYPGLVRLIDRFDAQRDIQFETFSSRRLVGAMRDYLRDLDTSGRQARQRAKRLHEVESRFWAEHGRRPDFSELRLLLGVSDDEAFRKYIDDARVPLTVSFTSSPRGGHTGQGGGSFDDADGFGGFQDGRVTAPPVHLEREDLKRWLTEGLSRRERLIVVLYYYEQMTMKETGDTLGCSESRVSQQLDSIIKRLRSRLTRVGVAALE